MICRRLLCSVCGYSWYIGIDKDIPTKCPYCHDITYELWKLQEEMQDKKFNCKYVDWKGELGKDEG